MTKFLTFLFICGTFLSSAQDQLDKIDVQSYSLHIEVNDENDEIRVLEAVIIKYLQKVDKFYLDLASYVDDFGMKVIAVDADSDNEEIKYSHVDDKLWIEPSTMTEDSTIQLYIQYKGVPKTGLIIGTNKFGERTFFGDNWPNRAHQWFACVDHPSDKATINFSVIAPKKYDCIATGTLHRKLRLKKKRRCHIYRSEIELPTKVMVIGLAEFKIKKLKNEHDFRLDMWAYEQDSKNGFIDMAVATEVVDYFVENIGYYPFEKLSNVQSTTQFGGMENAGNIFYDEKAVKGEQGMESLIAHEIAHQWFGNSASESDWKHIWLSEGFATYFTDLYWENKYGTEAMNERLIGERNRVLAFSKKYNHPVVDTTYESLMNLLNPHSYQKGAWVLHMLRNEVGDSAFWSGIRTYYETFEYGNAATQDFQIIMETASGKDLEVFFNQWLYQSQHPTLKMVFNTVEGVDVLTFFQRQNTHTFDFKLEVEFTYNDGSKEIKTFRINERQNVFKLSQDRLISSIKYDPNVKLLFEVLEE